MSMGMNQPDPRVVEELYRGEGYLDAYSQHTDLRVEANPQSAIGGMWEEIGVLQFKFLLSMNLKPHHRVLDVGCGTLRGGRHFIKYLSPSNYHGIDISPKAISSAKLLVQQEQLSDKRPSLLISESKDLKFEEFSGKKFDYILAQSVFTHLKPEHIEECFENVGSIMKEDSAFYFTYHEGEEYEQTGFKDFRYPFSFFEFLAKQHEFNLLDYTKDYNHPRGQRMVELTLDRGCKK